MKRVELAVQKAKLCKDYLFAVLFIDLDRFKLINDSLGHTVGDRLLVAIVDILKQCLRPTDTIARLGGDEFTILLDGLKDISDATSIASRLGAKLKSPFQIESHTVFTSASIGIVPSMSRRSNAYN
jgi:diguanylate cyclase (GGDEF)-like protein